MSKDCRVEQVMKAMQFLEEMGAVEDTKDYISVMEKIKAEIDIRIDNAKSNLDDDGE